MGTRLIYPPSMTFWQALQAGLVEPLRSESYLRYVRGLPCCACQRPGPGDPHHIVGSGLKGAGTHTSDLLAIPLCRQCHEKLHAGHGHVAWEEKHGTQIEHAARTLVEAVYRGVLRT